MLQAQYKNKGKLRGQMPVSHLPAHPPPQKSEIEHMGMSNTNGKKGQPTLNVKCKQQ